MDTNQSALPEEDVRVQKLSHAVAERLRAQIVSGQRKAGGKLPLESELLTMFKVSRPTVREALRILEAEALIMQGRGARSGATILGPTAERAADYAGMVLASAGTTIGELHQVRMLIMPSIVAQFSKKKDRKLLEEFQGHINDGKAAYASADYQTASHCLTKVHNSMARAVENRALALMIDMLVVLQRQSMVVPEIANTSEGTLLRTQIDKMLQAYDELFDLLRQSKAEEAKAFWAKQMERTLDFLQKSGLAARKIKHR